VGYTSVLLVKYSLNIISVRHKGYKKQIEEGLRT